MCGIAGAFGTSPPRVAAAMGDALAHRGPDDSGLFEDAGVAFAFRRLSIIDLTPCGHQPMPYANGRYWIVFNGEIYNFAELRRDLETQGHRFVSHSDTEVILAGYAQWGEEVVQRLRGMFAFAIYDRDDASLFLARDRFGIKPLYFTTRGSTFLFASELKAMLAAGVSPRLDLEAFWFYVSLGSVPQPHSALAGVEMLPAGNVMRVRRDLEYSTRRYWDLADAPPVDVKPADAPRRLRALLEEATRLHMVADVPVGAFLSGGIDSTAVVGLMTRASGQRIRTFSVGFADGDGSVADERAWARLAAQRFGSVHSDVVVTGEEVAAQFDHLVRAVDQPSLDGTNTYLVSQAASRELKVALSGLGGDELFAGYPHFRRLHRAGRLSRWSNILRYVPARFLHDRELIAMSPAERYATLRVLADDEAKRAIVHPDLDRGIPLAALYTLDGARGRDAVAQTTYVETRRYLADTLLRDADAMAMAWSLEVRPVLLDHKLAEFAFGLPASLKLGKINKPVLVDAVRDLLPPELLSRKKTGFELPLQSWLIGPLRERALDAFASEAARTLFARPYLVETTAMLRERRRPPLRTWAYLVLVEWVRAFGVTP
jgi:asparagine synthase (glutamine-hydrolysing)